MRKPKRTVLQQALFDAEKSVSGALLLFFPNAEGAQKATIRQAFVAALCRTLVLSEGPLTELGLRGQLSEGQLQAFLQLQGDPVEGFAELTGPIPPNLKGKVGAWIQLAHRYVNKALKREPEPPAVDWGRRELEFREQIRKFGQIQFHLDFPGGRLEFRRQGSAIAAASMQVLGTLQPQAGHYLAGWSDGQLPEGSRPFPVMGCASQLFRVDLTHARSEAHRCGWLAGVKYLVEHEVDDRIRFLGVDSVESMATEEAFSRQDVRPEVLAKLRQLETSLKQRSPKRIADTMRSNAQDLQRLQNLFDSRSDTAELLKQSREDLIELASGIKTSSLLGGERDNLGRSEVRELTEQLSELKERWS